MAFNWDGRIDYREKKNGKEYEDPSSRLWYAVMEMRVKVKAKVKSHNGGITHIGNVLAWGIIAASRNDAISDSEI